MLELWKTFRGIYCITVRDLPKELGEIASDRPIATAKSGEIGIKYLVIGVSQRDSCHEQALGAFRLKRPGEQVGETGS